MPKTASELWDECLAEIKTRVTDTQYTAFFEPIAFESFDNKSRALVLRVPNKSLVEYLEGSYLPILSDVLGSKYGQIKLNYRAPSKEEPRKTVVAVERKEENEVTTIATNLYSHYTFNSFIEGDSNKLARSVGITIAEHPRKTSFNPMFVYGPSGCGKTHLINAVGNRVCELYPRKKVLYVSANDFQQQYTSSVKNNERNDFLQFYQQFDMLIVDDVQQWEKSPKTSDAFFHIFNHLFMSGKRIVLAADRTPAELKNIDERMLTRFQCGILTELEKPDHKLCIDILRAKIKRDGLVIPKDVVEYIAANASGSVRDLEGIINSLLAESIFSTDDINMELAEKITARYRRNTCTQFDTDKIMAFVSDHYGIATEDILGKSRKREYVLARQVTMYFSHHLAKTNVNAIGRSMGNRDHSTVVHSIKKMEETLKKDKAFAKEMKELEREIKAMK